MPHSIRDRICGWLFGAQGEQVVERSPSTSPSISPSTVTRDIVAVFPEGSVIWSTEAEAGAVAIQTQEASSIEEHPHHRQLEAETSSPSAVQHHYHYYHYHYLGGTRWLWLWLFIGMTVGLILFLRFDESSKPEASPAGAILPKASLSQAGVRVR